MEKYRGILHPEIGVQKFHLSRLQPAEELRFFVERYWIVRWDLRGQEPYVSETLPYPCVNLVFEKEQSRVYGVDTGKFSRLLEGTGRVFGIKFRPGAFYPFIQSPVSKLTDTSISFRDVFGFDGKPLEETILSLEDEVEMRAVAERFLLDRLPQRDENVCKVNMIVDYIGAHPEISRVDELVQYLNLNKRTLQRLFHLYVGVSPKWVMKRFQLHSGTELLATDRAMDGTSMALELGYFDQAHFIKDFKAIVGKTPSEYAKKTDRTAR